jgi:hypothetical protein
MTTRLSVPIAALLALGTMDASAQQNLDSPPPPSEMPQQQLRQGGVVGPEMMGSMKGRRGGMTSPVWMRIIFALMDPDSDGTVSLQEWQAAHERIFKAMDANKDGLLSLEEIQAFMRGANAPTQQMP